MGVDNSLIVMGGLRCELCWKTFSVDRAGVAITAGKPGISSFSISSSLLSELEAIGEDINYSRLLSDWEGGRELNASESTAVF